MRTIDKLLDMEMEYWGVKIRVIDLFFGAVLLGLGMVFRIELFGVLSGDYVYSFADWMKECHEAGGIAYLGIKPGESAASTFDYNCSFQYIIVLLHYIGHGKNDLYLLKSVSVIFDVLCAITLARIAYHALGRSIRKAFMAFGAMMFLPSVVLNSAAWGQNDSIYGAFMLLSILHFMKGNDKRVFIYLAISYSFKQQAIFLFPFVLILWLMNKIRIRYVLFVPVIHVATMIPCVIAGRKLSDLLGIYGSQIAMFSRLSMNYPSIYTIVAADLDAETRKMIISAGTIATIAILGVLAYYLRDKKFSFTHEFVITLAIFTILLCCFCLPLMHERYGYIPEILCIVYGLMKYKRMVICAFLQVIAMITYSRFLFGATVTVMWPLTVAMLVILLVIGYDLYKQTLIPEEVNA